MNPYKTLRTIHAIAARMGTSRDADTIMNEALLVLRAQRQPGPYATQRDALEAIRGKIQECTLISNPFLNDLRDISELGLSLPPVEAIPVLTPAQQNADKLARYMFDFADTLDKLMENDKTWSKYAQAKRAEISKLCDLLRPAPPTLDEALTVLRQITQERHRAPDNQEGVTAAIKLLARVPK